MPNKLNFIGQRFGKLVVINESSKFPNGDIKRLCQCDCGNTVSVSASNLRNGHTRSCGCLAKEKFILEAKEKMVKKRFGRLLVIGVAKKNKHNKYVWRVRCDCGKEKNVCGENLRCGGTESCGCLRNELKHSRCHDLTGRRFGRLIVLRKSTKLIGGRLVWDCVCDCGKTKTVLGMNLTAGKTTSCGCYRVEQTIKATGGKNNWKYNPNLTDEDRIRNRRFPTYNRWLQQVYRRDKFSCQICGKKVTRKEGGPIAHHLNSWHWFKDGRTNLSNAITLCRICHLKFHKTYGFGQNTKEQFKQFAETAKITQI